MDIISVLTVGLFLNNVLLGLTNSVNINASDIQLENAASDVKNLGPSVLINFNNNTNGSSSIADNSTAEGTHPVVTRGHATVFLGSGNETGSAPRGSADEGTGKIMALSDDVITDALFTNIDTLQDHLEICEEELRQKMKRFSYYQLMTESADNAANKINVDEKNIDVTNDDSDDEVTFPSLDVDDERNDDNTDIIPAATEQRRSLSRKSHQRTRKRRFALIENEQPQGKSDILAQKVVERLSARMSYLRSSLMQCHLLVRQFG
ncbi:hypothetical protein BsWGS_07701 [Bradybaena similaris]